jgi:beta-galactosidase GanA
MGYGTDAINAENIKDPARLQKYSLLILPAVTIFDDKEIVDLLKSYVQKGGHIIITPLTDYITYDGLFLKQPAGSHIEQLTGATIKSTRIFGGPTAVDYKAPVVLWKGVDSLKQSSLQLDGTAELLEVNDRVQIIGKFDSKETVLNSYPAAVINKIGSGSVLKLAFVPDIPTFANLITHVISHKGTIVNRLAPEGVAIIPRTDKSAFIINTTNKVAGVSLQRSFKDRLTNSTIQKKVVLKPYEVLWVE